MSTVLRTVLGGGGQAQAQGQDAKLLEMADQDGNDTPHSMDTSQADGEAAQGGDRSAAAIASVITQAPAPGAAPRAVSGAPPLAAIVPAGPSSGQALPGAGEDEEGNEVRSSWRNKFRSIFCCLAPSPHEQYVRQDEGPVVLRPVSPPRPPLWSEPMLGPIAAQDSGKKCLVLDLDETLVHSSFKPVPGADYVIPVEIEGRTVDVYVVKRPFVDHFMRAVGQRFEVVVFTASLGKYADPLLDLLDRGGVVRWRLFREACYPYEGSYVKDLQCLGRDLGQVIIVDNSPHSYAFQPENALPIGTFIDDMQDQELLDCLDLLLAVERADDVRPQLGALLARRQAGLFTSLSQAVGRTTSALGLGGGQQTAQQQQQQQAAAMDEDPPQQAQQP